MAKVTVLGGAGAVGSVSVRTLANHNEFSEIVIGDFNTDRAQKIANSIKTRKISETHRTK